MHRKLLHIVLSATGLVCLAPSARPDDVPAKPVDGKVKWVYNYEQGKELARMTRKPMLVVFRCER